MMLPSIKVRELRVTPVRVPMREPHRTASGTVDESPLVLLDVVAHNGADHAIEGRAIVFTYTVAALEPVAALLRNLAPLVAGETLAPLALEQKLAQRFRLIGTQGLLGMALAGIDMALWDALARAHRLSLAALLGGAPRPIQAYGAVGYDGESGAAHAAEEWARRGLRGIKAKIGYPTLAEDLAVIRAMRRAAGDAMAIMVDYNQSLTPAEALERLRALDGEGLTWIEEPVLAHDFAGHALVAREARTPIQAGENWWGPLDLRHALAAGASDYIMADVMKIGGVTGWMRAAALAQAHAIRLSSHLWPELSAQLLSVTPTAHWLEYADWWNPILAAPLRLENGMAICDGAIGAGIDWDPDAVRRFTA